MSISIWMFFEKSPRRSATMSWQVFELERHTFSLDAAAKVSTCLTTPDTALGAGLDCGEQIAVRVRGDQGAATRLRPPQCF